MSILSEENTPMEGSLKQRAAKGAVWISVEMVGVQATSFAVFAAMAHFIGPRDFGLISISFLAIQSLQMLLLYNVATVTTRKQRATDLDYTTTFWITAGIAVFAFVLLLASSLWAERLFDAPGLAPVLQAMSVIILFMGLSRTHEVWMMRHFHFKSLAIRGLIGAIAGGVMGIVLAIKGFGVTALVGQQITNAVVSVGLMWVVCPWRPGFRFSFITAAEIAGFMRSILPNSFIYAVNQNCDTFLIAFFFGPVSAGFYNVGKRIRLAIQLVAGAPIQGIALPTLAEIQDDPARLRRGVLHSLALVCAICCPAFFGASAVAPEAISVIFGQKWISAVPVLELLAFGGLAMVLLAYNDNIYVLKKKQQWCLYISVAYSFLAIGAAFLCVEMKVGSLALPFVVPYVIVFPLSMMLVSRCIALSLHELMRAMLPGIAAATGMFIIVRLVEHYLLGVSDIARLIVLCAVGGSSYFMIIWIFWRNIAGMMIDVLRHAIRK